ncbi:MAG: diguanylate cyclase [Ignavibacteria bacterium]|nr:diguanylate cyclase [Ignavibacteria bacterium]
MNLLIGNNGSGKTSILEAIGYAMFDAKLRTTQKDAVREGESVADIQVDFTGNDDLDYTVIRKLGSKSVHKLVVSGESDSRVPDNDVTNKIARLAGITSNPSNIYLHVITANQNKLTEIFSETPANRERAFNEVFDTAIYGEIYKYFSQKAEVKYKTDYDIELTKYEEISRDIRNSEELIVELKNLEESKNSLQTQISSIDKELTGLGAELGKLNNLKNTIETKENNLKNNTNLLEFREKDLSEANQSLIDAINAEKVLEANQIQYDKYLELSGELKEISKSITDLEKLQTKCNKLEMDKHKIEKSEAKLNAEFENFNCRKNELIKLNNDKTDEKNKLSDELITQDLLVKILFDSLNKKTFLLTEFDNKIIELNSIKLNIDDTRTKLGFHQEHKVNPVEIEKKIAELKIKIDELNKKKEKLELYLNELAQLNARLNDNEEAAKQLSKGDCPFLKENCINISQGTNPSEYFQNKDKEIKNLIKTKYIQIEDYSGIDDEFIAANKDSTKYEEQLKNGRETEKNIKDITSNLALLEKERENYELKFKLFINDNPEFEQNSTDSRDFESAQKYLEEMKKESNNKYQIENTNYLNLQEKSKGCNLEVTNILNIISENDIQISKCRSSSEEYFNQKQIIITQIEELTGPTKNLPELKLKRDFISNQIESLQSAYNVFLSNRAKAAEKAVFTNKMKEIEKDIQSINTLIISLNIELGELKNCFSIEQLNQIQNSLNQRQFQQNQYHTEYGKVTAELKAKEEEIKNNETKKLIVSEIEKKKKRLQQKINLTNIFRDNIKNMGRYVSKRLLEGIEFLATENYRKISGQNESIRWINDDNDKYQIYLELGSSTQESQNKRRFEMLSGGEQVSVALAVRAAMASLMTKANFAIFDEPTVNLDSERRIALAESIHVMLKSLEQAIIVTHEDSFREMAQNVIAL